MTQDTRCDHEDGCEKTCPNHKWGHLRAHKEGWFFSKDRHAFCPDHRPEWVEKWRERKQERVETYVSENLGDLIARYAEEDGLSTRQWCRKVIFSALCRRYATERETGLREMSGVR